MNVGIAGTGRMGAAVAERLLSLGHRVHVWNRTREKAEALTRLGAEIETKPAALVASSEVVLSILTDADAIRATYDDDTGLLAADIAGKLFIEMSTVRAVVEQDLAQRVRERGGRFVEAPVNGTVGPARDGKLVAFLGGIAEDIAHAMPLLTQLCRRVEHVGDVGAGAAMKLATNLPMHVYWEALREALVLCAPLRIEPERLIDIMADTSGAPQSLRGRAGAIVAILRGQEPGGGAFDIDGVRKDLALMIQEAEAELPVTGQALNCFDEAAKQGLGAASAAALLKLPLISC